ncbi:MAG: Nucleoside-diphosphate-sugar epimerase, partial [Lacunisphaera sp.]|nr:Nucleoside-diphosphate-sugar epimerase [Lacunisphaera sp.]
MSADNSQPITPNRGSCYLVTGAAGFIGAKVCELLLADGHTVVGVDNLNDYYDIRLKDYRLSRLLDRDYSLDGRDPKVSFYSGVGRIIRNPPGSRNDGAFGTTRPTFEFHHLDIENLPALDELFAARKFEAVFNLAARAGVRYSLEFPELYRRTNVLGEENVLQCQVKYGVRKHVLASSSSVYAGCPMPFTEDATLGLMQSPYAETKRQAELLARDYHLQHGLDVTVLRYFTVFGPAGRPDMAPFRFIKWISEGTPITLYGDGTQARDFTYVDDIARGTILAGNLWGSELRATSNELPARSDALSATNSQLKARPPAYDIINLGGGRNPVSLHTIIGWIEQALTDGSGEKPETGDLRPETGRSSPSAVAEPGADGPDEVGRIIPNPPRRVKDQPSPGLWSTGNAPYRDSKLSTVPVKATIVGQPFHAGDLRETWADISKARRVL